MWRVKYYNKKLFNSQYKKLNKSEKTKLLKCLDMLKINGPEVKFADMHIIHYDGEAYYSMDLSKKNRLLYRADHNELVIILHDCGNHTINGIRYAKGKPYSDID